MEKATLTAAVMSTSGGIYGKGDGYVGEAEADSNEVKCQEG